MNLENSKALNLNPKKLFTLALVFVSVSLAVFVLTIIFFKLFGAQKNSTARVSVQAITCSVALVAYFFLRKKIIGEKIPDFSLPKIGRLLLWTSAGLVFSIAPYFITYDFDRIIWGNFRAELIFAATVFSLNAAIFEEILHRDLLFRFLLSRFHLWVAFFVQLFLFVGVHFFIYKITWINCLSLGIAGILFSLLWLLTKDFIASMLAHFISNFVIMMFNGVFTQQVARAGLLSGDPSLFAILLHIGCESMVAFLVLYIFIKKKIFA